MSWLKRERAGIKSRPERKPEVPEGLWTKCEGCGEALFQTVLEESLWTCPKCDHHFRVPARTYLGFLADPESFEEHFADLESGDPLEFRDAKMRYPDRLKQAQKETGMKDAALSGVARCTVYMSVPTVDEQAWERLEPGTAHPLQRLRAVRELVDAGVSAGVLMNPIVPGFSSSRDKLERTIKAIADHGARFVGCNVMFLEGGTRAHFMKYLEREFPSWLPRYEKLYERKYAPQEYRKQVQGMVRVLQARYGLGGREDANRVGTVEDGKQAEQVGFAW